MPQQEKYNWFGEQSDNNAGGNGNGNGWGHNGGGPGNHNGGGYGTTEPPDDPVDTVSIDITEYLMVTALVVILIYKYYERIKMLFLRS
jgi:hypothetical protein